MNEKERKYWVKDCLREYYEKDKRILIDISVLQIATIYFFLRNLIFFGNKILISEHTLNQIRQITLQRAKNPKQEIRLKNAECILGAMQRYEKEGYQNFEILQGNIDIKSFLEEGEDNIFCFANNKLYEKLKGYGLRQNLLFLEKGKIEVSTYRSDKIKFETIGAIKFEDGKMVIRQKGETLIRVYNKRGVLKEEEILEVKPTDYVLIRGLKQDMYSFNLYEIVSSHTRNQAVRIIWTDLKIGEKTNRYIDKLPYEYRKMILENLN